MPGGDRSQDCWSAGWCSTGHEVAIHLAGSLRRTPAAAGPARECRRSVRTGCWPSPCAAPRPPDPCPTCTGASDVRRLKDVSGTSGSLPAPRWPGLPSERLRILMRRCSGLGGCGCAPPLSDAARMDGRGASSCPISDVTFFAGTRSRVSRPCQRICQRNSPRLAPSRPFRPHTHPVTPNLTWLTTLGPAIHHQLERPGSQEVRGFKSHRLHQTRRSTPNRRTATGRLPARCQRIRAHTSRRATGGLGVLLATLVDHLGRSNVCIWTHQLATTNRHRTARWVEGDRGHRRDLTPAVGAASSA